MVRSHHHDRQALARASPHDLFGDLEPIHLRHATVEEQKRVWQCQSSGSTPFGHGLTAGGSMCHLCSQSHQRFVKDQAVSGMVIDYEGFNAVKIEGDLVMCR